MIQIHDTNENDTNDDNTNDNDNIHLIMIK